MKQYLIYDNKTVIAILKGFRRIPVLFTRVVSNLSHSFMHCFAIQVSCTIAQEKFHSQFNTARFMHNITILYTFHAQLCKQMFMQRFNIYSFFMQRFTEPVLCTAFHYKFHAQLKSFVQGFMHH